MATKTTGAEWKAFYNDPEAWPEGSYHEDVILMIDGEEVTNSSGLDLGQVPDDAQLVIQDGYIEGLGSDYVDLQRHFKTWRAKQDRVVIVVSAPRERADAVRRAVAEAGGTLVD